jgi:hypothetical protein
MNNINSDPSDEQTHVYDTNVNIFGATSKDGKSLQDRILHALLSAATRKCDVKIWDMLKQYGKMPEKIANARGAFFFLADQAGLPLAVSGRYINLSRDSASKNFNEWDKSTATKFKEQIYKEGQKALAAEFKAKR